MALFPTAKPKAHSLTGRITLPLVEQAFKAVKGSDGFGLLAVVGVAV